MSKLGREASLFLFHVVNTAGIAVAYSPSIFFRYSQPFFLQIPLGIYSLFCPILFALYLHFIKKRSKIAVLYLSVFAFPFVLSVTGLEDVVSSRGFFFNRPEIEEYKKTCVSSKGRTDKPLIIMFCEKIIYKGGAIIDVFYDNTGEIAAPPASRSDDWNGAFKLLVSNAAESQIYEFSRIVVWSYVQMDVKALGNEFYAVSYRF